MSELLKNEIKSISINDLEGVIAKAISEATGATFEASISKLKFSNSLNSETSFNLVVSKPLDTD